MEQLDLLYSILNPAVQGHSGSTECSGVLVSSALRDADRFRQMTKRQFNAEIGFAAAPVM